MVDTNHGPFPYIDGFTINGYPLPTTPNTNAPITVIDLVWFGLLLQNKELL
jgi:hypothetical protein